jgi:methionyl-tRNA formyltransferase
VRVVFLGSPPFAGPVLDALLASARHSVIALATKPDKPRGRGQKVEESELVRLARARAIEVLQPEKARDPAFVARLRELAPDVMLVASYGEILKQDLLDLPRHGCLNVHASLLPRHRGASPIQAAILAGDEETGVSVQRMALALDEGDVLVEERTRIGEHENAGELLARLAELGGRAAVRALDMIEEGRAVFTPQDASRATYAKKIRKEDGRIDWSASARSIERLVRAFTPWPGARTSMDTNAELVVLDVRAHDVSSHAPPPGTVLEAQRTLLVACGSGAIEIRRLKPAGKGAMNATDWLRGARLEVGARFGGDAVV